MRRAVLWTTLLAALLWAALVHHADHPVYAQDRPLRITVYPLVDAPAIGRTAAIRAIEARLATGRVADWLGRERERHSGMASGGFVIETRAARTIADAPPETPAHAASLLTRFIATRRALRFFDSCAQPPAPGEVDVFLVLYDSTDRERRDRFQYRDSFASPRHGRAVVFAPLTPEIFGHVECVIAHEICHLLGARDKYDGGRSIFPDGFVEPDRTPLRPQEFAEIMALERPVSRERDDDVTGLDECRVGVVSAREMGWSRRAERVLHRAAASARRNSD